MERRRRVPVVLVVDSTEDLAMTARTLRDARYEVVEADSFEQARSLLSSLHPDLLITDIRLGAHNGLHLVWLRHLDQPERPAIVTNAYADAVLETEARKLGCAYLLKPIEPQILLRVVGSFLDGAREVVDDKRHSERTRLTAGVQLVIDQTRAAIMDISYGGCRLRLEQGAAVPLARPLRVPIPTSEFVAEGVPLWKVSAHGGDVYGVAIRGGKDAALAWIRFVDDVASAGGLEV